MFKLTPVDHNPFSPKTKTSEGQGDLIQQIRSLIGEKAVSDPPEEPTGNPNWNGHVHILSSFDPDLGRGGKTKIHAVFANQRDAVKAHQGHVRRSYADMIENIGEYRDTRAPYRTSMERMTKNGRAYPSLDSVYVGGQLPPDSISAVHEGFMDPSGVPKAQIHGVWQNASDAKSQAEKISKDFYDDGHQQTRHELSAKDVYNLHKAWDHPEYPVDRNFDFVNEENVPPDIKQEHMRRFMDEIDAPQPYPGLSKANDHQRNRELLSDGEHRTGIINISRHPVIGGEPAALP